ncbi:MAG: CoA protein activase, partial [Nitrospirae bacterium]
VRLNNFSNEELIRKIEDLGGEVWLAPMEEWIHYINTMGLRHAINRRKISEVVNLAITRFVQKRIEHKLFKTFNGHLKTLHEPPTKVIMKKASPYIHDSFEGEAILSIGKSVDFVERGASGIISAVPFGCMPGTVVDTLLRTIKEETGIPCITMAYDGSEDAGSIVQLEAFMYQARQYMNEMEKRR